MHCYVHVNTLKFFVNQTAIIEGTALEMNSSMLLFYNSSGNVIFFSNKKKKEIYKVGVWGDISCEDALLNTLLN